MTFKLCSTVELPDSAVTETFAIVGKRGMGKTSTAVVLVEEMVDAGHCAILLDPVGVLWGLQRAGVGAGKPIIVLGGDHGDMPLESSAGHLIADIIVETRKPMVLDLSRFSKTQQRTFVADFAEQLYRTNRDPIHVVLDEADTFAPQRVGPGEERMLGAVDALWRRGRARGIGGTLISQRPAVVNKNLLSQSEVLITHRIVTPHDRKAISDWVEANATDRAKAKTMLDGLSALNVGEAWVWSPGWLDIWAKVQIRPRTTFDSSATPKPGARAATPGRAADIDLDALRVSMAALVETKAGEDPKLLKQRVAELEAQLANPAPAPNKAIPILGTKGGDQLAIERMEPRIRELIVIFEKAYKELRSIDSTLSVMRQVNRDGGVLKIDGVGPRVTPASPPPKVSPAVVRGGSLSGGERRILTALAQHGLLAKSKLAILAGYSAAGGGFNNYLSSLRTKGYIGGSVELGITVAGEKALGTWEPLPTGKALFDWWSAQVDKAGRNILSALRQARGAMSKSEVATVSGYDASGGGFNNALSRLRTLQLIYGSGELRLHPTLVAS